MHPSDLAEREILHQKSLPCVSTPADFILVFRALPNRLACIILLNCYNIFLHYIKLPFVCRVLFPSTVRIFTVQSQEKFHKTAVKCAAFWRLPLNSNSTLNSQTLSSNSRALIRSGSSTVSSPDSLFHAKRQFPSCG